MLPKTYGIDLIIPLLKGVTQPDGQGRRKALCPFHLDTDPSLRLFESGGALCFGSCDRKWSPKEFAIAMGLEAEGSSPPPIESVFDYRDEGGAIRYQVVRRQGKKFTQRRPDPAKPGEWIWNMTGVARILYNSDKLAQADKEVTVFVVEGEKDADRLAKEGLLATTNVGGGKKWAQAYSGQLQSRSVVVLPDNDVKGREHAEMIASMSRGIFASLKVVYLPDLPDKGDVSDWLNAKWSIAQLQMIVDNTPEYIWTGSNGAANADALQTTIVEYEIYAGDARLKPLSENIIRSLKGHGEFISANNQAYYFNHETKLVCQVDSFEMELLLRHRYNINSTERIFNFLSKDLLTEAALRGKEAGIQQFAYYDNQANVMQFDLGKGRSLKLDGNKVTEVPNGTDGVLFLPDRLIEPWVYKPDYEPGSLTSTLLDSLNFMEGESTPLTPDEQKLLFLTWYLAIPFESIQPTKAIGLVMGPKNSGKTSLLRRWGRLLFGPQFEVNVVLRDKPEDFYVATTSRPLVAYDNVDQNIPWLEDALATSSTGARRTMRELFTTNRHVDFTPKAFIGMTARTPRFRRDDVASRLVIWHVETIKDMATDFDLNEQVRVNRNLLMSEYVDLVNQVVRSKEIPDYDRSLRIADFAQLAARIGGGLGIPNQALSALKKLKGAQYAYTTEEDALYHLLMDWIDRPVREGTQVGFDPNSDGRMVSLKELGEDLTHVAENLGLSWKYRGPVALGRRLQVLQDSLAEELEITKVHREGGNYWRFLKKQLPGMGENGGISEPEMPF